MEKTLISNLTFVSSPKYVGGYRIGKGYGIFVQFNLTHKPNWFHRQFAKILLGWHWYDVE